MKYRNSECNEIINGFLKIRSIFQPSEVNSPPQTPSITLDEECQARPEHMHASTITDQPVRIHLRIIIAIVEN